MENGVYMWGLHVTLLGMWSRLKVGVTSNRDDLAAGVRDSLSRNRKERRDLDKLCGR